MLWGSRCLSYAFCRSPACELTDLAPSHWETVHELRDLQLLNSCKVQKQGKLQYLGSGDSSVI